MSDLIYRSGTMLFIIGFLLGLNSVAAVGDTVRHLTRFKVIITRLEVIMLEVIMNMLR